MKAEINPKTGRAIKVYESEEERLNIQNERYHSWRKRKLETDPVKLAEFRRKKNEASKRCIQKKKDELELLRLRIQELESKTE